MFMFMNLSSTKSIRVYKCKCAEQNMYIYIISITQYQIPRDGSAKRRLTFSYQTGPRPYTIGPFARFSRVFTCFHVFPRVSTCSHVLPRVSTCFHVFPRVSTCFHVFPRVSTCFHVFPRVFACFHVLPRVSTCFHVFPRVSRVFTCLQVFSRVDTADHVGSHALVGERRSAGDRSDTHVASHHRLPQ